MLVRPESVPTHPDFGGVVLETLRAERDRVLRARSVPAVPVDIRPLEPEHFALPQSEGKCDGPTGTVSLLVSGFQDALDLVDLVRFGLDLLDLRSARVQRGCPQ